MYTINLGVFVSYDDKYGKTISRGYPEDNDVSH
jgi:hypothetical protein